CQCTLPEKLCSALRTDTLPMTLKSATGTSCKFFAGSITSVLTVAGTIGGANAAQPARRRKNGTMVSRPVFKTIKHQIDSHPTPLRQHPHKKTVIELLK